MASIVEQFQLQVEAKPTKLLYAFLDIKGRVTESFTYAQFYQRTTDIALHLQQVAPSPPGGRVLLAYPPGIELIAALFACFRLGWLPVPVYPPTGRGFQSAMDRLDFIARDCGAHMVLTDRTIFWSVKWNQAKNRIKQYPAGKRASSPLRWVVSTDAVKNAPGLPESAHSDVLFLQYTSGSTSEPKGVMVTHDNVLANCESVVNHEPIGVSWLPQYHDMGLIGYYLYFAIKGGTTYGFSPVDFIQRPALWLEAISRYGGTASSAPDFAYAYCLRPGKLPPETFENLDLSSLQFLMTAAEPVRADTYRQFRDRFAPYGLNPQAFFSAYGLAEYTIAVCNHGRAIGRFDSGRLGRGEARVLAEEDETVGTSLVSCGAPLPGTEVRIVDVDSGAHHALPDGAVGEIWIRGPSKCKGYWGRPALSKEIFEARLNGDLGGSWLRSGDLGFLASNELYICGRLKDLVIIRGRNYYPQDIEGAVEEDATIRKGCVAAFSVDREDGERLVVVAELKDHKRTPSPLALNQRLLARLGVVADTFVFIAKRSIHKTSSGKISRHRVSQAYESRTLQVLEELEVGSPGDIGEPHEVPSAHPLADLFQQYGLTGEETWTLDDAGLDSIGLVSFAHELQRALDRAHPGQFDDAVDLRLLQNIQVCDLFELVREAIEAGWLARRRFRSALTDLQREHRAAEMMMMSEDAALRPITWTPPEPTEELTGGGILLTGGTGFLGPFLLQNLLEQTEDDIYVLVRGTDPRAARARLLAGVAGRAMASQGEPNGQHDRIQVFCGDLEQTGLGLSRADWDFLAQSTHTIFHNGALVNYLHNYDAMRDANVLGTREMVRLAFSHRPKVFNHISTTFVFGWSIKGTLSENDHNADMELLDFGYSQSKWVAEQVVRGAMECGLQARIFRPALISPSVKGEGDEADIAIRLLAFIVKYGLATKAKNQVSFTPVDQVACNIVAISNSDTGLGQTFHVTRDEYANLRDVTDILGQLSQRTLEYVDLGEFVDSVIERCTKEDPLFPLLNFFVRSVENIAAMEFKRYDNSNYRAAREAAPRGQSDPSLEDVATGIARFMGERGMMGDMPLGFTSK